MLPIKVKQKNIFSPSAFDFDIFFLVLRLLIGSMQVKVFTENRIWKIEQSSVNL